MKTKKCSIGSGGRSRASMLLTLLATLMLAGMFGRSVALGAQDDRDRHDHACTLASLNGPYGFTGTGTINGEGPVASVGTFTFDGEGIIVGHFSQSRNGNLNHQSPTGTYTVNSNCTGSWTLSNGSEVDFVIVAGGDELMWVRTDPGVVITAVGKKQFEHHDSHE